MSSTNRGAERRLDDGVNPDAEALNASRPLCDIAQGSAAKERERKSQTERRGG